MASIPMSVLIKYPIGQYSFLVHDGNKERFNEGLFFNHDDFLNSRQFEGKLLHFELKNKYGKMAARMNVNILGSKAYSPWKAPFGSIECHEDLDSSFLKQFVLEALEILDSFGITVLSIIHYPEFYDAIGTKKVDEALLSNYFKKETDELNQHIVVGQAGFEQQITYSQRKRLNKCKRSGFEVKMEDKESLAEAYELLVDSRERKNYPITMSFEELSDMFNFHPSRYLLFAVRNKQKMVAIAISIRISPNIIYNFYHADHHEYGSFSPTVMAVGAVFEYCQQHGITYIDLGISSLDGKLNEGIYKFKKGLGAIDGIKCKYLWHSTEI